MMLGIWNLPAVEVLLHQLYDLLLIVAQVMAQGFIVEGFKIADDPVDHAFGEYSMLQVNGFLAIKCFGRFPAGSRQMR